MHERTERAMARLTFVLCCAVPTLIVLTWIVFTWTPWYHQRCLAQIEARLAETTGLIVQIEDFDRTTPLKLRLSGVRLLAPETGREIARVHQVTWAAQRDEIVFVLQQPELQSAELGHVWRLLHDRFLCRPDQTRLPVNLFASDLTIHSRLGPLTLRDLSALVTPQEKITLANIIGVPADSRDGTPIKIHVTRDRRDEVPTTTWTLETGNTALPCSALAECFPIMENLGPNAMYSGVMRYIQHPRGGAALDLSGSRFTQVELSRLFERLPHKLTGTAELHMSRCLIQADGKATDVTGTFRASDGLVGGRLLQSFEQHMGFMSTESIRSADIRELAYDRISLGFKVLGERMELVGICHTERDYEYVPRGTLLCAGGQGLLQTSDTILPTISLLRAIAPGHSELVPISQQTSMLADLLKAPSRPLVHATESDVPRVTSVAPPSGGPTIQQR